MSIILLHFPKQSNKLISKYSNSWQNICYFSTTFSPIRLNEKDRKSLVCRAAPVVGDVCIFQLRFEKDEVQNQIFEMQTDYVRHILDPNKHSKCEGKPAFSYLLP